jgi:hypothetical protein
MLWMWMLVFLQMLIMSDEAYFYFSEYVRKGTTSLGVQKTVTQFGVGCHFLEYLAVLL